MVLDFTNKFTVTFTDSSNRWTESGTHSISLDGKFSVTLHVLSTPLDGKCAVTFSIYWAGIAVKCYMMFPWRWMEEKSNRLVDRIP